MLSGAVAPLDCANIPTDTVPRRELSSTEIAPSRAHAGAEPKAEPQAEESLLLALPYDFPRTVPARYEPKVRPFEVSAAVQAQLRSSGDGRSLLLAGLAALLHRYTQQTTIQLGIVNEAGHAGTLVVEASEQDRGSALVEAITHQCRDLDRGDIDRLQPPAPRVVVAFVEPAADVWRPGPWGPPDLQLTLDESGTGGTVVYNTSLFRPDTIQRMIGHWNVVTEALAKAPAGRLAQAPWLTPREIAQLTIDWQPPRKRFAQVPLFHAIRRHASERPDAIAVSFGERSLSYAELEDRSNRLAHHLRRHGVEAGAPVAVRVEPSLDIAVCVLAIFKAGGAHVPIDPSYPADRQSAILADVGAAVLLTQTALRGQGSGSAKVILVDGPAPAWADEPASPPENAVALEDVAFVVYTSGTTGRPKGVIMTHANLVNYIHVARELYRFGPSDVQPAMARFSFSITMFELLSPLVAGGRLLILERDHVLDFKRLLATLQTCTVLHASPSLLRKLMAFIREQGFDVALLDGLRHVSSGGDLVSPDVMEAMKRTFRRAELYVIYGCSEIACMGCTYEIPRTRAVTHPLVGRPFANVTLRICDAHGNLVPVGVPGEIHIGGAGLGRGYVNLPDQTRERFVIIDGERYYRTGDLGRYHASGDVEMLGRSDFQIKLRGIRIELGEIEVTLRRAPGVREAVVVARDLHGEKALVAYVVLEPNRAPGVADLRRFLQAKLPDYMVPAAFMVLDALPVNLNQKVDRRALPPPDEQALARPGTLVAATDPCERQLLAIWTRLLHSEAIGVEDSFFDVGGDSLSAVGLMVEIERQFGKALPLSTLLTEPTVAGLARVLRAGPEKAQGNFVPLRTGGARAPVFFVHDGDGETLPYRTLAHRLGKGHPVYGIQPKSRQGYPMLHSRLADIADEYTREILRIWPSGPYLLGGLCIGGFIAFEIARRLRAAGRTVGMVALIDVAHVKARPRSLAAKRLRRLSSLLGQRGHASTSERVARLLRQSSHKLRNLIGYELRSRYVRARNQTQMRLFRMYLDRGWELPPFLADIPVNVVLRFAEKEYVVPEPYEGEVLLFRATKKSNAFDGTPIDDTPYVELFEDKHLGWQGKTTRGFIPFDIPAGHSSMLQEPHVGRIAEAMQAYIDTALAQA